jgi:hypothetical protein
MEQADVTELVEVRLLLMRIWPLDASPAKTSSADRSRSSLVWAGYSNNPPQLSRTTMASTAAGYCSYTLSSMTQIGSSNHPP